MFLIPINANWFNADISGVDSLDIYIKIFNKIKRGVSFGSVNTSGKNITFDDNINLGTSPFTIELDDNSGNIIITTIYPNGNTAIAAADISMIKNGNIEARLPKVQNWTSDTIGQITNLTTLRHKLIFNLGNKAASITRDLVTQSATVNTRYIAFDINQMFILYSEDCLLINSINPNYRPSWIQFGFIGYSDCTDGYIVADLLTPAMTAGRILSNNRQFQYRSYSHQPASSQNFCITCVDGGGFSIQNRFVYSGTLPSLSNFQFTSNNHIFYNIQNYVSTTFLMGVKIYD